MSKYMTLGIAKEVVVRLCAETYVLKHRDVWKEFFSDKNNDFYTAKIPQNGQFIVFTLKDEILEKYGMKLIKEYYKEFLNGGTNEIKKLQELSKLGEEERRKAQNEMYKYYRVGINEITAETLFERKMKVSITEFISFHTFENIDEKQRAFHKIRLIVEKDGYINEIDREKYYKKILERSSENPLSKALVLV